MSSVPGRSLDNSLDSSNLPTMSSAAMNMRFETMPRPYNDGIPDRYAQPRFDTHAANQAQRAHRLPPPQSLVAGVPCAPDYFSQTQDHQYFRPTYFCQDGSTPGVPTRVSPPPLPSPSRVAYPSTNSHQIYPARNVPVPAQPPQTSAPVAVSGSDRSPGPRLSRFSQGTESAQSQPRQPPKPYQPHLETGIPLDTPKLDQRTPKAALAIKHEPSMASPSPRQHRADSTCIPNLLGASRVQALANIKFRLRMRQQPNAARACGFGDRDRRVIDPPPIVELVVEGSSLAPDEIRTYLRYESYVMSCAIYDESGTRDSSNMPEEYQHQRRLMGSLVATPFVGQDENGQEGCFFCFSDLSCRTPGTFRLKFTLMMIDPIRAGMVKHFPILAKINSEPFKVYSAKEFPGMVASSNLAKRLKEQGCIISIKKGNDRTKNARGQDERSDNDEDDDDGSQGQRKRRVIGN